MITMENRHVVNRLVRCNSRPRLIFFFTFLAIILLLGCVSNDGADTTNISAEDAGFYCEARSEWDLACEDKGGNLVIYDTSISTWGWVDFETTAFGQEYWRMRLNTGLIPPGCTVNLIRHEIGHVLGYKHGEHPWVLEDQMC